MLARLVPTDGTPPIMIDEGVVSVGRSADCDVRIESAWVSRRHCTIELIEEDLFVRDLNSTNGTFRNCERIQEAVVLSQDELWIGNVRYLVVLEKSTAETISCSPTAWDVRPIRMRE